MKLYSLPSCSPCQQLKRTLKDEGFIDSVEVVSDASEFPQHVRSVPTLETDMGTFVTGTSDILNYFRNKETKN